MADPTRNAAWSLPRGAMTESASLAIGGQERVRTGQRRLARNGRLHEGADADLHRWRADAGAGEEIICRSRAGGNPEHPIPLQCTGFPPLRE